MLGARTTWTHGHRQMELTDERMGERNLLAYGSEFFFASQLRHFSALAILPLRKPQRPRSPRSSPIPNRAHGEEHVEN